MTIPAPKKLPYDVWFDLNPLKGSKYIQEPVYESCDISLHEEMYKLSTKSGTTIGGSRLSKFTQ